AIAVRGSPGNGGAALVGLLVPRHERKRDREGRALAGPGAFGLDGSAMRLDQVPHDRETQAETAKDARARAIRLREAIEHVRQEVRVDAHPRIADSENRPSIGPLQRDGHTPALRSELERV